MLAAFGAIAVLAGLLVLGVTLLGDDDGGAVTTTTPAPSTLAATVPVTRPATTALATSPATSPATTTPPTTRPAATTTATTTRPTTTTTRAATTTTTLVATPATVDELIGVLSSSTASYGRRASTLLADLREIQAIDGKRRGGRDLRRAATDELAAIDGWLREGSIDPTMAAWAQAVLRPLAN